MILPCFKCYSAIWQDCWRLDYEILIGRNPLLLWGVRGSLKRQYSCGRPAEPPHTLRFLRGLICPFYRDGHSFRYLLLITLKKTNLSQIRYHMSVTTREMPLKFKITEQMSVSIDHSTSLRFR